MNSLEPAARTDENMQDQNCMAIDKTTGEYCRETESLRILDEFQKLYKARIETVDQELEDGYERTSMKLQIMSEWIKDLAEQNVMLVNTVQELERTAYDRVILLNEKLRQSSTIMSKNVLGKSHTEDTKALQSLSQKIDELQQEKGSMVQKIDDLKNDIKGLIELIHRARLKNNWDLNGITFHEIEPLDILVPFNCISDQGEPNNENLKLHIRQVQDRERIMIEGQKKLEQQLADVKMELDVNPCNCNRSSSMENDAQQDRNIPLNANNLKTEFDKEFKKIADLREGMAGLHKVCESLNIREISSPKLASELDAVMSLREQVSTLQGKNNNASMQIAFKEDIIRKKRSEFRQTTGKSIEITNNTKSSQDQIILYLIKTKALMETERSTLFELKQEIDKVLEKLHLPEKKAGGGTTPLSFESNILEKLNEMDNLLKIYKTHVIKEPNYAEHFGERFIDAIELLINELQGKFRIKSNESDINSNLHKLYENVEIIIKICSEKKKVISTINSMIKMERGNCHCVETPNANANQQHDLMVTTNIIKKELDVIVLALNSQRQTYANLRRKVANVHNQLMRTRESTAETINKLQLQEQEKIGYNGRLKLQKNQLKDIKNKINLAQPRLTCVISDMQKCVKEQPSLNYSDIINYNNLLNLIMKEIDEISSNTKIMQTQEWYASSILEEFKTQIYDAESSMKELQRKLDEMLQEHTVEETTFKNGKETLKKLETELDTVRSKAQEAQGTFNSTDEQDKDVSRIMKEYDDLKFKLSRKMQHTECENRMCEWKLRVADLEDEVRSLQCESKCKQEANDFLRNSIQSMEEELYSTKTKAESQKRSLFTDRMELKKKIMELESALETHNPTEFSRGRDFSESRVELKKSKEMLNSVHSEDEMEGMLLRCDCNEFSHETINISHLFKALQNVMQSTKNGLQDLKSDVKTFISEGSFNACSSAESKTSLIVKLQKYDNDFDKWCQEIEQLKSTLHCKEKLLENMQEIFRIQKDSIAVSQDELKELHQKLQEKIDTQDRTISQCQMEKKDLLKQNELQVQTIGHLQNAVVEAKRYIDQMGQKTMSDLQDKNETILAWMMYAEESQGQYNECFMEAVQQEKLLDLQRDDINSLQKRIRQMEHDTCTIVSSLQNVHYSVLRAIQEQLEVRANDMRDLKNKQTDTLAKSKLGLEDNQHAKTFFQERKLKECPCDVEDSDKKNLDYLIRENEDLKRQLQKWKLDVDIIDKELKIERENDFAAHEIVVELQKLRTIEHSLRLENQQLKSDLEEKSGYTEKLLKTLENKQINVLQNEIKSKEAAIKEKPESGEKLKEEVLPFEENRIQLLTSLLEEKSHCLAQMQADYEVLKNENQMLQKAMKNNGYQLKLLKEVELEEEFIKACDQKVPLQEALTNKIQMGEERFKKLEAYSRCLNSQLQECTKQNCFLLMEKSAIEEKYCKIIAEIEGMKASLTETSAELRNTAISRSELRDASQNFITYIRVRMEQQKKQTEELVAKLKSKQRQLIQLGLEKRTLSVTIQNLRRVNCLLAQKLRKLRRPSKSARNARGNARSCEPILSEDIDKRIAANPKLRKKCSGCLGKNSRQTFASLHSTWCLQIHDIIHELRKNNRCKESFIIPENTDTTLEESRDGGYQSSTSKSNCKNLNYGLVISSR